MRKPAPRSTAVRRVGPGRIEEIVPPNLLLKKLGPGRGIDPELLIQAETAVFALRAAFEERFMAEIDGLQKQFNDMKLAASFEIGRIAMPVRELTGEGGTYGYPLVSRFGRSLYLFMADVKNLRDEEVGLIDAHFDAMRAVVGSKIRHDGGKLGRQMVMELQMVRSRLAVRDI